MKGCEMTEVLWYVLTKVNGAPLDGPLLLLSLLRITPRGRRSDGEVEGAGGADTGGGLHRVGAKAFGAGGRHRRGLKLKVVVGDVLPVVPRQPFL